jgi:hypothetical protein
MSVGPDVTELEAAARRLAALADRLRAVRAQLDGKPSDDHATAPEPAERPEDQTH